MQIVLMFVVALALVPTQDPPQDQTLTGCLRTGSSPTVFLLRGASLNADATPSGPRAAEDYLLVSVPASLGERVNHRIAVTGVVSDAGAPPPPPPAANAAEKALKKLSVKDVKEVAANCSASSR
jgi:hypothetical protein